MRWGTLALMAAIACLILMIQWGQMKEYPSKDKRVVIALLLIGCFMSAFDLQDLPGPLYLIRKVVGPLATFME